MISHEHRAIFIHIQKTGGDSISAALGASRTEPNKHWLASELKASCAPEILGELFQVLVCPQSVGALAFLVHDD